MRHHPQFSIIHWNKMQFSPGESRGASGYQSPNNEIAAFQELNDKNKSEQCKHPDLDENFAWRPTDDLNAEYLFCLKNLKQMILNCFE